MHDGVTHFAVTLCCNTKEVQRSLVGSLIMPLCHSCTALPPKEQGIANYTVSHYLPCASQFHRKCSSDTNKMKEWLLNPGLSLSLSHLSMDFSTHWQQCRAEPARHYQPLPARWYIPCQDCQLSSEVWKQIHFTIWPVVGHQSKIRQ